MLAICPNSSLFLVSTTASTHPPHCHPFRSSCEAQTTKVGQPVITSSLGSKDPNNFWAVIIAEASSFKLLFIRYDCKIWRFSFSFDKNFLEFYEARNLDRKCTTSNSFVSYQHLANLNFWGKVKIDWGPCMGKHISYL